MSQQPHEVDVCATVETLWKLHTPPVDVSVPHLWDGSDNFTVSAKEHQIIPRLSERDLKITGLQWKYVSLKYLP